MMFQGEFEFTDEYLNSIGLGNLDEKGKESLKKILNYETQFAYKKGKQDAADELRELLEGTTLLKELERTIKIQRFRKGIVIPGKCDLF